jgi:hypothetical protein
MTIEILFIIILICFLGLYTYFNVRLIKVISNIKINNLVIDNKNNNKYLDPIDPYFGKDIKSEELKLTSKTYLSDDLKIDSNINENLILRSK